MRMSGFNIESISEFTAGVMQLISFVFVVIIFAVIVLLIYFYIADVTQTKQAIRRNYPVIGRFRYFFEHIGEFFRQYFFALDREELPFNRAQRAWVYRAAKNVDATVAFGSTRPLNQPGDILFLNCLFPTLTEDAIPAANVTIGQGVARRPYTTSSLFNISGMSFGALSIPAITALSKGAKKAGIWMNTGEGALSEFHLEGGCDIVYQIGTAKYGVRNAQGELCDIELAKVAAYPQVKMFEIKMSQGAKPGKGGILPGEKVTAIIAKTRNIPEGVDSISPNGHPEISSVEDLLDMIHRVREATGKPVGFKVVIGTSGWLDDLCKAIHLRGVESAPDFITIDSADGGTGAAPQSLIDFMGQPIKRSLPLVVDKLMDYNLRGRIKIICSGKLINPSDVAWALCMGADFVTSARGFMFALGCIQALQCNKNTCPTGITTHDEDLQKGLNVEDKGERVYQFANKMMYEVGMIAHSCGVTQARQLSREHTQIINEQGIPMEMLDLFPIHKSIEEYADINYGLGEDVSAEHGGRI
jgi:glutamate synthase domain-containing protein 2